MDSGRQSRSAPRRQLGDVAPADVTASTSRAMNQFRQTRSGSASAEGWIGSWLGGSADRPGPTEQVEGLSVGIMNAAIWKTRI